MNTKGRLVALIIHADDFGITVEQSKAILELSDACGGHGAPVEHEHVREQPGI